VGVASAARPPGLAGAGVCPALTQCVVDVLPLAVAHHHEAASVAAQLGPQAADQADVFGIAPALRALALDHEDLSVRQFAHEVRPEAAGGLLQEERAAQLVDEVAHPVLQPPLLRELVQVDRAFEFFLAVEAADPSVEVLAEVPRAVSLAV